MKVIIKDVKSILTKTKLPACDYVVNPYVGCSHKCIYCYAEFMSRFTDVDEKWGDYILVKNFSGEIYTKKLENKRILFSSITDPYQPINLKYNKTAELLSQFINSNCSVEILTKSKYLLKDISILEKIPNLKIGISLTTLDDTFRKKVEPGASSVTDRLDMLKTLHGEGFYTYLFISPIFPYITDYENLVDKAKDFVNEIWFENLNLRGAFKFNILNFIQAEYSKLYSAYKEIYVDKTSAYWEEEEQKIRELYPAEIKEQKFKLFFYHEKIIKK